MNTKSPCNNDAKQKKTKGGLAKSLVVHGLLTVSTFEFVRGAFEAVIAHWASLVAIKVFSAVSATAVSVVVKLLVGRMLRQITFSKGDIKMGKLKAFFKWVTSNKKSLAGTVVGATGAGLGITAAWTIDALPVIMANGFNVAPIIYTVVCTVCFALNELGICGKGFESIKTYIERVTREREEAEAKAIEIEAQKQIKQAEAEAKAIEIEAQKQIKAEEERKKEAERNAKVQRKKAELLAKTKK